MKENNNHGPKQQLIKPWDSARSHRSQESRLLRLIDLSDVFCSPSGKACISLKTGGRETYAIPSAQLEALLRSKYFEAEGEVISKAAVRDVQSMIEAVARANGKVNPVCVRVGRSNGRLVLDLANKKREVVLVSKSGWEITQDSPVCFGRPPGTLPLPTPEHEANGGGLLRSLIDVSSEEDYYLLVGYAIATLFDRGQYPVLVLNSEPGSGKSTASRILKSIVDPNVAALRLIPRDERDLMIAAANSHVLVFDNISYLPKWLSDALCQVSGGGGGLGVRKLYTDDEQIVFQEQRPIILNGLGEVAKRNDLKDRAIVVILPGIPSNKRRSEQRIWAEFHEYHPRILGWLLDVVSESLGFEGDEAGELPRLADFAARIAACEPALGLPEGYFAHTLELNRAQSHDATLDASPIGFHILDLADEEWEGTASSLLEDLNEVASRGEKKLKAWPQAPRALADELRRIVPSLRSAGLDVEFIRRNGGNRERLIRLRPITEQGR